MNRLNIVTIGTKDIVRAYDFFGKLGFIMSVRGEEDNPDIIFFKNEGSRIALFPIEELALDIDKENPPIIGNGFSGITLAYNAKSKAEVIHIMELVELSGGKVVKKPQNTDWGGYGGYFMDLDGYYWEVAYGDFWEFDDRNMLVIK